MVLLIQLRRNFKQYIMLWYESPRCKESHCYWKAFRHTDSISKVWNFLFNFWNNKTYQILEISAWQSKTFLKHYRTFPLITTSSFHKSTSSSSASYNFLLLSVGFGQKLLFFFLLLFLDICDARNIKPAAAIHRFSTSLKCCMMYSLNCMCPLNVIKKIVTPRKCVLSRVYGQ